MSSPANHSPLRWATTHPHRLRDALTEWRERVGTSTPIDLRANAYGFGDEAVASLAEQLGFVSAALDSTSTVDTLRRSDSESSDGWVDIAHHYGAFSLHAQVINSKAVDAGAEVSYGGLYRTTQPSTLALIAIGFADGLPRLNPVGGHVAVAERRLPIAGRIAMDQIIVDTGNEPVEPGESVTIWGGSVSCAEWAEWSGRSCALLGGGLGERVVRIVEDQ